MRKWKKLLGILLVAVMAIGLCACGKKKGVSADPSLAKQNVYRMQEFDLNSVQKQTCDNYIMSGVQGGDKVYFIIQSYDYTDGDGKPKYTYVSMNKDGSNIQTCQIQTSMDGAGQGDATSADGEGSGDATSADGEGSDDATPVAGDDPDTDIATDELPIEGDSFYEYEGIGSLRITENGDIYGMRYYNFEDYSDPENNVSIRENYVCGWDQQGKMLWQTPLEDLQTQDSWSSVNNIVELQDGSIGLFIIGDKNGIMKVNNKGELGGLQAMSDDLSGLMDRLNMMTAMPGGKLFLSYYDENWMDMYITSYDLNTGTMGEQMALPSSMAYRGMNALTADPAGDLLYTTYQGVYKYHPGDSEPVMIMNFINSDLDLNGFNTVLPVQDGQFVGLYTEYDEEAQHSLVRGGLFNRVDPKDVPDKAVLVLAGNNIPWDLRKRAINFNKTSSTHRIVLKEYSDYATFDDYNAGVTALNNDIISGNMPDILVIQGYSNMSVDNYASKKLLADIGKLIEQDEELSKVEFVDNVFEACKLNGKLYEIVPYFSVQTYGAKTSLVGQREAGWTMEEAQAVVTGKMPEGAKLFGMDISQTNFISGVMEQCGRDYVDVSTGKCNFNSPEFIALLEFAKTLPTEEEVQNIRDDGDWEAWYKEYEMQYRENRTLLASTYIGSFQNLVNLINGSFGEDVTFVGFPGSNGNGGVVYTDTTYVLSAKSADLDAAWDFMRYYLTDEYQDTMEWQFPVLKKKFEENAQKATEQPYYIDETGEKCEYKYTYYIGNEEIELDPLTQEQVDRAKDYVCGVKKRSYRNQDVTKIIEEEVDACFKGQKSAADVAGIIQSRVQLYVNENR